jgi:hypothetical protein
MKERKKRFWDILRSPDSTRVGFPGYAVSDKPLYSMGYANCNAVVLFRGPYAALSHYDTRLFPYPEENLQELLGKILSKPGGENDILAVLVGGDRRHFERNMEFLEKQRIPLLGRYLDSWSDYEVLPLLKQHKDLVVIPQSKEVIMHRIPRYRRLSPRAT